jgi:type IV fimbrial biogenesis protein FimT
MIRKYNHNLQFKKGFTLVEMLVVITIMVMVIAIAIPGWRSFMQNNQAMILSTKLAESLSLARTTAIQSGQAVVLCPIAQPAGTTCVTNTTAWDAWVSFIDVNSNGTFTVGTGENYSRDIPTGAITANVVGSITFTPAGFFTAQGRTFTIKPSGCYGNNGRIVTILPSGNIQASFTSCQ